MIVKAISFENYKAFREKQTLSVKPVTILIGKNSSGKSSIAKLFTLLENSLSGKIEEPLHFINNEVELGGEFLDLVYGKQPNIPIRFSIVYGNDIELCISVLQEIGKLELTIFEWSYKSNDIDFRIELTPEGYYIDSNGKKYSCKFAGMIPKVILSEEEGDILGKFTFESKIDVDYIGPFRILPEREFYLTGQIQFDNTGVKGENAYALLGVSKIMKTDLNEIVGEWYKNNFDGWQLVVVDTNRPFIQISLNKGNSSINIVDVGQGMNQALPLVVRSNISKPNSIVVVEQPELHLHPAAHGDIIELFARSAKKENQFFVVETHSENMLLRLRKLIVSNDFGFTNNDVVIYWVDDSGMNGQRLTEISISENGVLSEWPEGVFNENVLEIIEMQKALSKKPK